MFHINYTAPFKLSSALLVAAFLFAIPASKAQVTTANRNVCDNATNDNNIWWAGVKHDSFDADFRAPFGAVQTSSSPIRIRLRTCAMDLSSVRLTAWDARKAKRVWFGMVEDFQRFDEGVGPVQYWRVDLPVSDIPTISYYFFELKDGSDTDFYTDDNVHNFPGGYGIMRDSWNDSSSFQITVFDKNFKVPEWTKGAIVYQIFPDRFRNGDSTNDPQTDQSWVYGLKSKLNPWFQKLCDPLTECPGQRYNQFYGGDLQGIIQKLDDLKSMGVSAIYLNPIFESPTNHKYDTTNFMKIDPAFGSLKDFQELTSLAKAKGINIILDGVLNHVSADSPYFDLWGRWNDNFELTTPDGPGTNDASGACESENSRWRSWFYMPDIGSPAVGTDRRTKVYCPNPAILGSQAPFDTYEAWFGFYNVPKINTRLSSVRDFFFQGGSDSVVPFWMKHGAAAWRLDVAGDIDSGWTRDPSNSYWEDFRDVVKAENPSSWIIGEEWGDATPWLLGHEWDSVMNYRLRSALLNWMFDGCSGFGCSGKRFYENDSNDGSPLGPIAQTSDLEFMAQLTGIQESFPEQVWHSALNLLGSHDTNRILFLLKKISGENSELAKRKLLFLTGFLMAYPGAPSIYYGDEVGVDAAGVWSQGTWQDDPYNRAQYPWSDLELSTGVQPDMSLKKSIQDLGSLRASSSVLQKGTFQWIDSSRIGDRILAFERELGAERVLILLNRSNQAQDVEINKLIKLDGLKVLEEQFPLKGRKHYPGNGRVNISQLEGLGIRILRLVK